MKKYYKLIVGKREIIISKSYLLDKLYKCDELQWKLYKYEGGTITRIF